jgi:cytochrome c oxidase cbb3-type subunit III
MNPFPIVRCAAIALCVELAVTALVFAQPAHNPADVELGARLYQGNCASCHGQHGDAIAGVDLGRGKFRQAQSDADLVRMMKAGIPGTPMPPANLTDFQAGEIVIYLRAEAAEAVRSGNSRGDAARGRAIFEGRGRCLDCHRVRDQGSRVGPDLTDIGSLRRSAELETSVLDPDAEVLPQNRSVRLVTKGGATITGRLLNHDTFSVQLIDSRERLLSVMKADLREFSFVKSSPMPAYRGKWSAQELDDLVAYLVSLKGVREGKR